MKVDTREGLTSDLRSKFDEIDKERVEGLYEKHRKDPIVTHQMKRYLDFVDRGNEASASDCIEKILRRIDEKKRRRWDRFIRIGTSATFLAIITVLSSCVDKSNKLSKSNNNIQMRILENIDSIARSMGKKPKPGPIQDYLKLINAINKSSDLLKIQAPQSWLRQPSSDESYPRLIKKTLTPDLDLSDKNGKGDKD